MGSTQHPAGLHHAKHVISCPYFLDGSSSLALHHCSAYLSPTCSGAHPSSPLQCAVLLPEGTEPIKALHSFRDNKTTLLLCTPAAARGLDLPAVRYVAGGACSMAGPGWL